MIYRYIFIKKETPTPDRLLMGGFIFAMSSGLEETLKVESGIQSIKVGDKTLLFEYGRYILGIAFVSENIPLIFSKINQLIKKFEKPY